MSDSSHDPQKLLRAHKIGTLDVDWLVNARNLNTDDPVPPFEKKERKERAPSVQHETHNELPPEDPRSSMHIHANLPEHVSRTPARGRSNSVVNLKNPFDTDEDTSNALRKTKSLSAASPETQTRNYQRRASISVNSVPQKREKKMGFFKSLFSGIRKSSSPPPPPPPKTRTQNVTAPSSRRGSLSAGVPLTRARTASMSMGHHNNHQQEENHIFFHHHDQENEGERLPKEDGGGPLFRARTHVTEEDRNARDSRLAEFLRYYKANGYPVSAFRHVDEATKNLDVGDKPTGPGAAFQVGGDDSGDEKPPVTSTTKYDARGRPIPPHPTKSKLPPALKGARESLSRKSETQTEANSESDSEQSTSNRFGSFLKRVTSHHASTGASVSPTRSVYHHHHHHFDPTKLKDVPGLENMKPLRHVSFASNTYFNDPPQQICSKHPRRGEVEVKPNGSVVVHRLTPEQRKRILETTSAGVVVGGSGQLKLLNQQGEVGGDARKEEERAPAKLSATQMHPDRYDEEEEDDETHTAQHRNIRLAAAEAAAEARAKDTPNELTRVSTNNEEEVGVSGMAKRVTIDKPMISRRSIASNSSLSLSSMSSAESSDDEILPPPHAKIPHDVVYTRCCHLREILPIPATLKQLIPGSTDPIPLLQLRNPRPSLVEVWSFSDFLSIAPVLCLSLDGVTLSVEMFRIILSAILGKKGFEKLSLRNTPIDHEGWQVLCYFVSKSECLSALDLTMVPQIKTNAQKPSKSSLRSTIVRMESDMESRSDMNWDLLAASVAAKGGLEEIVISSARMPADQFENFIDVACIATVRLGLAYNALTKQQCQALSRWLVQSKVTGLDMGFNDLKGKLSALNDVIWDKVYNKRQKNVFRYISLNCTGLEVDAGDVSETNEVLKLISLLCYCEDLKFLDISNNPKIFPHCLNTLIDCLPVCAGLTRLHLDYESLEPTSVVTLAEALPLCTRLNYLSMLGNKFDLASYKALAEAVKKSPSLITLDVDYSGMPQKIREKLSLYTMKNVDNELNRVRSKSNASGEKSPESELQEELSRLLSGDIENKELYDELVHKYVQRVNVVRTKIGKVVHDLFAIRMQGQLNVEGKETLIRLCFVDASLEKRLELLEERMGKKKDTNPFAVSNSLSHVSTNRSGASEATIVPSSMASTAGLEHTGHSALLPFGRAEVEAGQEQAPQADDTVELVDKDENGNPIKHDDGPVYGVSHHHRHSSADGVDKEQLGKAAKSLDTDKIKDYLMKSDVNEVVGVIDELHNQGYRLHDLFKKQPKTSAERARLPSKRVPLRSRTSSTSVSSLSSSASKAGSLSSRPSTDSLRAVRAENEAIDAAYDQVLDNLQRDRTQE
ncbi:related to MAP-homologous protein 1 [Zygosaccharomyces bailii ISA1307]|nr:related to MAP-homologous protein 1 [Zygosaccharomyces bailii ISA1307]